MDAFPRSRRRHPNASAASVLAFLLSLLLLGGSIDLHLGEEEAHAAFGLQPEQYTLGASHPQLPLHMERGVEVERPRCQACLAQLQKSGAHLPLAQSLPVLVAAVRLAAGEAPCASCGTALRPLGRAPPLA